LEERQVIGLPEHRVPCSEIEDAAPIARDTAVLR
jgi:hypothetical protein